MTLLQLYLQKGVVVSAAFRDETGLTVTLVAIAIKSEATHIME
jgi:hypothetical protein